MKLKINQELKDAEGKAIITGPNKPHLYLKDICISSILQPVQGEDEKTKWAKYEIFKKIRDAKTEVDLITEEIAVIKKAISHFQPVLIMGQSFEMIEGKK